MLMTSNENLETLCRQLVKIEIILLLPTMATRWEKQLSLPNERVQIRIIRKNLNRKQPKSCLNIINNYNAFQFQITVILKRRKLTTILTEESHDIKVKIFNTVDRAAAASRHP
jgi:hypothetical protein